MFKFLKQKNPSDGTPVQKFLLYVGIPISIIISITVGVITEHPFPAGLVLFILVFFMSMIWDMEVFGSGGGD